MKRCRPLLFLTVVLTLPAAAQQETLARLSRETHSDIPRSEATYQSHTSDATLRDSATSRRAAEAFFVRSDLARARRLAERALHHNPQDAEALFVGMEVAALEGDEGAELDQALRLCEAGATAPHDLRVRLAAVRLRELAANTPDFRRAIPRLQSLLANSQESWKDIHEGLLNAAMDGAPGLNPYALARDMGILSDWRIVGPLGSRPLLDFDQPLISPADDLSQSYYQNRAVENFQFPDGWVRLPDYLPRRGVFYASGHFASFISGTWTASVEAEGSLELYVDGRRVLRTQAGRKHSSAAVNLIPGPHRVLLKFTGTAAPLRVAFSRRPDGAHPALRARISLAEAAYLLAAEHYANDEPEAAIRQIDAVRPAGTSIALQFLLAQSLTASAPGSQEATAAWLALRARAPQALAADVALGERAVQQSDLAAAAAYSSSVLTQQSDNRQALEVATQAVPQHLDAEDLWARRLRAHPSCRALRQAVDFYQQRGLISETSVAKGKLDGCAPESLDYAQVLSGDGDHAGAVRALQVLLAGAPLNRAGRLMLVRELQLSGNDEAAEHAAANWLHVAPNAGTYHRLAASASNTERSPADFYLAYRRDAAQFVHDLPGEVAGNADVIVLDDHVAFARPDGSVALYVHTARRLSSRPPEHFASRSIPAGAQVLRQRVLHEDGTAAPLESADMPQPGDTVDSEYVVHFAGDGGIPEHAEAFQYVFGSFDEPVLNARFVVLTPADRAAGGVVIVTGDPPVLTTRVRDGMLERMWQKNAAEQIAAGGSLAGLAIVRVVEQENGWSIPSDAEHHKRIETIHPGPQPEDS